MDSKEEKFKRFFEISVKTDPVMKALGISMGIRSTKAAHTAFSLILQRTKRPAHVADKITTDEKEFRRDFKNLTESDPVLKGVILKNVDGRKLAMMAAYRLITLLRWAKQKTATKRDSRMITETCEISQSNGEDEEHTTAMPSCYTTDEDSGTEDIFVESDHYVPRNNMQRMARRCLKRMQKIYGGETPKAPAKRGCTCYRKGPLQVCGRDTMLCKIVANFGTGNAGSANRKRIDANQNINSSSKTERNYSTKK